MGNFRKILIIFIIFGLAFLSPLISNGVEAQTSSTTVTVNQSTGSVIGIVGGYTMPISIYVNNVNNSTGLAAFGFRIKYDPNVIYIPDTNNDGVADAGIVITGPFLGSLGKSVTCSDGLIDKDAVDTSKKDLTFICNTLGSSTNAPRGSGILATINFKTGNTLGPTTLSLVKAQLADNTASAALIPNTMVAGNVYIAPCADLVGGDGKVTTADILYVVSKYHTSDPAADLNHSGTVLVDDILIAVGEYNMTC